MKTENLGESYVKHKYKKGTDLWQRECMYAEREALDDYFERRLNSELKKGPDSRRKFPEDGLYKHSKRGYPEGSDWYYLAGHKDLEWMKQQDKEYLRRISQNPKHYDLFLREMTPDADGPEKGLDLSLDHHRILQLDFAAEVVRVCQAKGLQSHPALDSVLEKGLAVATGLGGGGGGGGRGPAVDEAQLKRLEEENAQLKVKTGNLSRDLAAKTRAHDAKTAELAAKSAELIAQSESFSARLQEEKSSVGREWEGKLSEKDRLLSSTQSELDRSKAALREKADDIRALNKEIGNLKTEVSRLAPLAVMAPLLPDEAHKALLRVWRGKYGEGLPDYKPAALKDAGSSVGFIAQKAKTKPGKDGAGKRWMAKLGLPDASDAAVNSLSTRRKDFQRTTITSVKEKIAADVYAILGNGHFYVPKHRLANLKIMNEYTQTHPVAVALLETLNRGKPESEWLTESVHLLSKWMNGYQDLAALEHCVLDPERPVESGISFVESLKINAVPAYAYIEGKTVPILGLMEILAVSRLLGDTDVLGGGCKNAGFVVERDGSGIPLAVRLVKIDAGESFNFEGADNQLDRYLSGRARGNKLKSPKDLQFGNNQPINILWKNLSAKQERAFLETLKKGLAYLKNEANLNLIIEREGEFDKAAPPGKRLLSSEMIKDFKEGWKDYMDIQTEEDIYGELLKTTVLPSASFIFRPKQFGAVHLSITDSAGAPVGGGGEGAGAPERK